MVVGVISDTHGLLRPEVLRALDSCEHILHAGDVGDLRILEVLREIAPVTAVRGNVDVGGACAELPETEAVELGGKLFYLVHALADLGIDARVAGIACVVSGHTHRAEAVEREGVLYLNPGSVGPRRFKLPVTLAKVTIGEAGLAAEMVELSGRS